MFDCDVNRSGITGIHIIYFNKRAFAREASAAREATYRSAVC